jgi:transcriptional regulator with XRE-family HTH domain
MNIALAVKKWRKYNKIKQYILAKEIGVTQSYLSLIESGKKTPSIEVLEKVCEFFNKPMPVLLWFGLEENDIPENKREIFKSIKPSFDELLKSVFL